MDCIFSEIAMRCMSGASQREYAPWPNDAYACLFDHASRRQMNAVSLGNLVEQVAQVLFLNGHYALLQCLAVSAAKATENMNPSTAVCSIKEGLKTWAIQHRLRYGSLVVSCPWQRRGLQIWHPPHGIPEWAHCDLAVCDRFYVCVCPSAQDAAPAGAAGPRCSSADNARETGELTV